MSDELLMAEALHGQGRLDEAEILYRKLAAQVPHTPRTAKALTNLGMIHHIKGESEAALALHQKALGLAPDLAEAWCNLGDLWSDLGQLDKAENDFARASSLAPGLAPAWFNLGNVRMRLNRPAEALESYRRAAALLPQLPLVHAQMARCLDAMGHFADAARAMEAAVRLAPSDWGLLTDLGAIRQHAGQPLAALAALRSAIALNPGHAATHYNLGNTFYGMGDAAQAVTCWRQALTLDPQLADAVSNFLNGLHYLPELSGEEISRIHREMMELRPIGPCAPHANSPEPDRVIRIGYVSADFRRHPLGLLMRPVLRGHDRTRFFTVCYATSPKTDEITGELRTQAGLWREVADTSDETLARLIRDDGIDILVDLDGQTAGNRLGLFALKPAPVQVSWLGYPFTTGMATMDYALMDRATIPVQAEGWFSETVICLPGSRLCYQGPEEPEPAPSPVLEQGCITFGSFNNIAKLNEAVIASWSRIMNRVPGSRLVLKWPHLAQADVAQRYQEAFAARGIAPDRLDLRGNSPPARLLAEYADVDIALDPFPYCGAFTSCEALWMGVPVVTFPGPRPFSRQTLALLRSLELEGELARQDLPSYEDLAVTLAGNPARLQVLRGQLRPLMRKKLGDAASHLASVEAFFRQAWGKWCEKIKGKAS